MQSKAGKIIKTLKEITQLPVETVTLEQSPTGKRLYDYFNKAHATYKVIKHKTIGVALVCLTNFKNADDYLNSVNGKNSAAYFSRKAAKVGYVFKSINPNEYIDAIFNVNTSATTRQGRAMDDSYKTKMESYPVDENNTYFAVFKNEELVAYLWVVKSGELAILNRLLGHQKHLDAGVMYLMITSFISSVISSSTKYVMYDTFFGATDGLKMFKKRCGFRPYKVKWKIK